MYIDHLIRYAQLFGYSVILMRIHPQLVVAMGCGNAAYTHVPLPGWALISLDETWLLSVAPAFFSHGFSAYVELLRAKA